MNDFPPPVYESHAPGLKLLARGKVRDIYEVDDERLLIVATDRLSAFDVVLPDPVPGKGAALNAISNFWFAQLGRAGQAAALGAHHLLAPDGGDALPPGDALRARAALVRRAAPLPFEAIVRGRLAGGGWREYQQTGGVCGEALPPGLAFAAPLPQPIFTPSTKAAAGAHDVNVPFARLVAELGADLAGEVRRRSLAIYRHCAAVALKKGIVIADTKFEFGLDQAGELLLIDEALTPDSSRFWPAESLRGGGAPVSMDKQFVRDYLETLGWNKRPPAPRLPQDIIARTAEKYRAMRQCLTGA